MTDLTGYRSSLGSRQDDYVLLLEIISREPLGPLVRQGDCRWFTIIKWVHFVLVEAEELGVKATTVVQSKRSKNQEIRRRLGLKGKFGKTIDPDPALTRPGRRRPLPRLAITVRSGSATRRRSALSEA